MKMPRLCLLLLLLLSALSLSEGRVLSRCELRDELLQRVQLPRNLQRNKERAMARVICEVERFSSLNTALVREYQKEIIDLDDSATTASPTTTMTTTTTTPTTAPPRSSTAQDTSAPEQPSTKNTSPPPIRVTNSTTTTAPMTSPTRPPNSTTTTASSNTALVSVARRRRAVRQKRASVSVISVKFFGIFQFSDRTYCNSGYSSSEDRCMSDCYVFADEDISNDLECFVQSRLFWEVYRGANRSCRSRRTLDSFFEACDAGETPQPADQVVARVFISGGTYK